MFRFKFFTLASLVVLLVSSSFKTGETNQIIHRCIFMVVDHETKQEIEYKWVKFDLRGAEWFTKDHKLGYRQGVYEDGVAIADYWSIGEKSVVTNIRLKIPKKKLEISTIQESVFNEVVTESEIVKSLPETLPEYVLNKLTLKKSWIERVLRSRDTKDAPHVLFSVTVLEVDRESGAIEDVHATW